MEHNLVFCINDSVTEEEIEEYGFGVVYTSYPGGSCLSSDDEEFSPYFDVLEDVCKKLGFLSCSLMESLGAICESGEDAEDGTSDDLDRIADGLRALGYVVHRNKYFITEADEQDEEYDNNAHGDLMDILRKLQDGEIDMDDLKDFLSGKKSSQKQI